MAGCPEGAVLAMDLCVLEFPVEGLLFSSFLLLDELTLYLEELWDSPPFMKDVALCLGDMS